MIHVSEMLDLPVVDSAHRRVGRLDDVVVDSGQASVERLVVRQGRERTSVAWSAVDSLSPDQGRVVLNEGAALLPADSAIAEGEALSLRRDVLDRQIIDIHGRKVVRVNDIVLESEGGRLFLRRVEVGLAGAVRRLFAGIVAPASRPRPRRRALAEGHPVGLRRPRRPALGHDPPQGAPAAHPHAPRRPRRHHRGPRPRRAPDDRLRTSTPRRPRRRSPRPSPSVQAAVVEQINPEQAADLLEEMPPDEAADILGDLSAGAVGGGARGDGGGRRRGRPRAARVPRGLGGRPHDHRVLPRERERGRPGDVLEALQRFDEQLAEDLDEVPVVTEDERLVGIAPLVRLLRDRPGRPPVDGRLPRRVARRWRRRRRSGRSWTCSRSTACAASRWWTSTAGSSASSASRTCCAAWRGRHEPLGLRRRVARALAPAGVAVRDPRPGRHHQQRRQRRRRHLHLLASPAPATATRSSGCSCRSRSRSSSCRRCARAWAPSPARASPTSSASTSACARRSS